MAATCGPAAVHTVAVPIAAVLTAGVTTSHRIGVGRRHGMLGMFCIDPGIIL